MIFQANLQEQFDAEWWFGGIRSFADWRKVHNARGVSQAPGYVKFETQELRGVYPLELVCAIGEVKFSILEIGCLLYFEKLARAKAEMLKIVESAWGYTLYHDLSSKTKIIKVIKGISIILRCIGNIIFT